MTDYSWLGQHYQNPTGAQFEAYKKLRDLQDMSKGKCTCETKPSDETFEMYGKEFPTYIAVTKVCDICAEVSRLWGIADPDDTASSFT